MFLPITKLTLILCLAFVPSVWPQTTKSLKELFSEIFVSPSPNSVTNAPNTGAQETAENVEGDLGADTGAPCETDAGVTGTCMLSTECKQSDTSQTGNCVGFLEVCCAKLDKPSKFPVPLLTSRKSEGCGRRRPSGVGERANFPDELQFAYFGEFPWMVGILTNQISDDGVWSTKTYQGGGTLITPRAVLTAAHIVRESLLNGTPLKVRAGESDIDREEHHPYIESPVQQIILHERYNHKNFQNDIALLILKDPINANLYIDYACLPAQGQAAPTAKNCIATGWGKDTYGSQGKLQHRMKKIEMPIVPRDECQKKLRKTRLGPFFELHSSFVCAGNSTLDTCEGDGGSPLVCPIPETKLRYMLYGIVAWGVDCADGNPGGYVDVADFRDWVDNKMKEAGFETATYNFS